MLPPVTPTPTGIPITSWAIPGSVGAAASDDPESHESVDDERAAHKEEEEEAEEEVDGDGEDAGNRSTTMLSGLMSRWTMRAVVCM